jgi:hypothetical protein
MNVAFWYYIASGDLLKMWMYEDQLRGWISYILLLSSLHEMIDSSFISYNSILRWASRKKLIYPD